MARSMRLGVHALSPHDLADNDSDEDDEEEVEEGEEAEAQGDGSGGRGGRRGSGYAPPGAQLLLDGPAQESLDVVDPMVRAASFGMHAPTCSESCNAESSCSLIHSCLSV
jgi:hypothetical protein